jgi:hypothetical protein
LGCWFLVLFLPAVRCWLATSQRTTTQPIAETVDSAAREAADSRLQGDQDRGCKGSSAAVTGTPGSGYRGDQDRGCKGSGETKVAGAKAADLRLQGRQDRRCSGSGAAVAETPGSRLQRQQRRGDRGSQGAGTLFVAESDHGVDAGGAQGGDDGGGQGHHG